MTSSRIAEGVARERMAELARAEAARLDAVSRAFTGTSGLPGSTCWNSHPPGRWLCGCTPLTRYGALAGIADPVPSQESGARIEAEIASVLADIAALESSQEALHREVTGRTPAPTLEGWRDEFVASGGDYAKGRMLSYVTLDARCIIDPLGETGSGSCIRAPGHPCGCPRCLRRGHRGTVINWAVMLVFLAGIALIAIACQGLPPS